MLTVAGHQQDPGAAMPPNKGVAQTRGPGAQRIRSWPRAADCGVQTFSLRILCLVNSPLADHALVAADLESAGQ